MNKESTLSGVEYAQISLPQKPRFVYRTGCAEGAKPLCRGHGGVPRIWLYHPLPGEEGGRGDGRNGRGAPTLQERGSALARSQKSARFSGRFQHQRGAAA